VSLFSLMCYVTQHNAVKFVKKGFGEKEVKAVLERLDRLTHDEARTTASQTLEVIHGLVQNMRVVMDGKQAQSAYVPRSVEYSSL
jgi:hypothetical protein